MSAVGANALFNVVDLIAASLEIIYGFILYQNSFEGFIIPVYIVFFGILIFFMVFYIPKWLLRNVPFYSHFLGRGLTFLFNALLVIDPSGFGLFAGSYIGLVSLMYISISIIKRFTSITVKLPPPFFFSQKDNIRNQYTRDLAKSITQTHNDQSMEDSDVLK